MQAVDPKMPIDVIDSHIQEFIRLADKSRTRSEERRFIARGAYLSGLRDVVQQRLENGWWRLVAEPDDVVMADFWFDLLYRYERLCDVLKGNEHQVTREQAARFVFDGEAV